MDRNSLVGFAKAAVEGAVEIIAQKDDAIAACERQVNELAEINKELLEAVKMLREEFAGLPHSLGYYLTHLPKIDEIIAKAEQK